MLHPNRLHNTVLGRKEVSPKAKIALRDFVDVEKAKASPAVPERTTVDWTTLVRRWPMFLNNQLGDCVCAGAAHGKQIWNAAIGEPYNVVDADVLRMYEQSGYRPGDPATDQGWTLEAGAEYLRTTGLRHHPDIDAYAHVDLGDEDAAQVATELFGGLYIGAALPLSAQTQYSEGRPWTLEGNGSDAGTWGGHCVWRAKSTVNHAILLVTWGGLQEARIGWQRAYIDEQLALVPADWRLKMPPEVVELGVVDFSKLESLLATVGK